MSRALIEIDPARIDKGKIGRAARRFDEGGLAVLPTDTSYVLACRLGDKQAIGKLRLARSLPDSHLLTMLLANFKSLGKYAVVDNAHFKLLRANVPGPYTFIMRATRIVPATFAHKKRKTVGIRVPGDEVARAFIDAVGMPLASASLKPPGEDGALSSIAGHEGWLGKVAATVISAGDLPGHETTILDLSKPEGVAVVRQGAGDTGFLAGD